MEPLTQKRVAEILDMNPNTIQGWARDGLVIPSIENPKGRGSTRQYSPSDLTLIKVLSELSQISCSRIIMKNLCDTLNDKWKPGVSFKKLAKAKGAPPAMKELANIKEDYLNPLIERKGSPVIIRLSNGTWELGYMSKAQPIPGNYTRTIIINLTKIMNEIRIKLKE